MKFDEFKSDISNSLDMKASALNSKNILPLTTNLQLISPTGHFSSRHIFIPMNHNSPNISNLWPQKATPFFKFKNCGMPLFLPYDNIFNKKELATIQTTQSIKSQHLQISPPTRHTSQIYPSKRKLQSILKSNQSPSCPRYHHLLIKITKTTCQTHYIHE